MFNGRIVGVSPGTLVMTHLYLAGVLPEGLLTISAFNFEKLWLQENHCSIVRLPTNGCSRRTSGSEAFPPEPTDEERAAAAGSNIVYDDRAGNPVKVEGTDDYVTTEKGQYVSQAELQRQHQA